MSANEQIKEFNEKYKISAELQSKFSLIPESERKNITTIAGKPKNIFAEMAKRFFTNPVVTIAFIIFIIMILCSIIIPAQSVRQYDPNIPILTSNKVYFLPPAYSEIKSTIATAEDTTLEYIKNIKNNEYFSEYFANILNAMHIEEWYNNTDNVKLEYNAYDLLWMSRIIDDYTAFIKANASEVSNWTKQDHLNKLAEIQRGIPRITTLLGTNGIGSDIWTTTWYATWRAFKIAFLVAIVVTVLGVAVGAYIGFHAGKLLDTIIMRVIEIFTSVPELIWLLIFVSLLGSTDKTLIIALILTGWAGPVAGTRMFIITVKDQEYISAAKAVGASTSRQVFVHALPAIIGKIANSFVKRIPAIILSVSSLAFLGFFKEKNDINLGQMLIDAVPEADKNVWILLLPALILLTLSVSLHFIAVGIHDCLDPRIMSKRK
ncbi:ABC-type dipeptide/oligopeptide/nickel transport system permease protein (DppC/OppC) domain protein [Metamycoplasma cloacale]|nr:ABC transporter permease [Metamycoplasma cloacale]VEU79688.1 ABC-type dipeptide/oligopeptide/nickel transport system permease protein (DppC/OppC) domain protein [Metamycoplasma cloacale]